MDARGCFSQSGNFVWQFVVSRRRLLRQQLVSFGCMPPYVEGSPQGHRSAPSPVCQQVSVLLSGSDDSDKPAGSVSLSTTTKDSGLYVLT